jgi:hypothetical protein
MKEAFITYPRSIKSTHYCFKLNTDDYIDPKPIDNYLKQLKVEFKRTKQQHATKCIGWHVYKIKANAPIKSFEENISFVESLFTVGSNFIIDKNTLTN